MGKGDKKTRKGKIWKGTFGKARPHKPKLRGENPNAAQPKEKKKKAKAKS